jgi:hypothetical protein
MIYAIIPASGGVVPVEEFRSANSAGEAVADYVGDYTPPLNAADYQAFPIGGSVPGAPAGGWYSDTASPSLVSTLGPAKAARMISIDRRTSELIAAGFVYAGKRFSLSLPSQSKMIGVHQIKDNPSLVYPLVWNTDDDLDVISIASADDLDQFYLTALATIRSHLDTGTSLKDAVRLAATVDDVSAAVDNR